MNGTDIVPASLETRITYSKALAASDLLPKQYRSNPANVLVAVEYGAALGLSPMAAIQGIHVVEGKPTASAQLIGALVRNAGHRLRVTGDDKSATAQIVRRDDPEFTFEATWTMERAKNAGLAGKAVWKQYAAAMLKARAITEVSRDACPEVLSGVAYTAEELEPTAPGPRVVSTQRLMPKVSAEVVEEGTLVDTTTGEIIDVMEAEVTAAESEVVDAEIVDDEPAEPTITKAQSAKLFATLRDLGIDQREPGLEMIGSILGREVESTKTLSKADASLVIDTLTTMQAQGQPTDDPGF